MRRILGACAAILSFAVATGPAAAQLAQPSPEGAIPCGPRDTVLEALEKIGEVPVGVGVAGNDGKAVIELTVGPDGSWSVLVSDTDGQTCLVLGGQEWDFAKPQPTGEPA
jgi:hypothetical protein